MIDIILLCLGTASLSCFLDMCMEPGMILRWYYLLIDRLPGFLFKPLGGCVYCFGTWVFVLFFFLLRVETNLFVLFLGMGFNYSFIKAIERYVA